MLSTLRTAFYFNPFCILACIFSVKNTIRTKDMDFFVLMRILSASPSGPVLVKSIPFLLEYASDVHHTFIHVTLFQRFRHNVVALFGEHCCWFANWLCSSKLGHIYGPFVHAFCSISMQMFVSCSFRGVLSRWGVAVPYRLTSGGHFQVV